MMPGAKTMGRPKRGGGAARKGPTRAQPQVQDERFAVIHLKGSAAYVEWLDALNRATHIPKAALFRLALAEWAERHGHPAPPEL